jgi:hypothetical protein
LTRGACHTQGPICLIQSLHEAPGPVYQLAYVALRIATKTQNGSLNVWEWAHGRTQAEVVAALDRAIALCSGCPTP